MKAVILAAGKGTRLGELTQKIPKPMVLISGVPLLALIIQALPDIIDEVVLVVGYRAEDIRNYFGDTYKGRRISYVDGSDFTGTAGALFKVKDMLHDRFLVLNGDDLLSKKDLLRLLLFPRAIGVFEGMPNHAAYFQVETDPAGMFRGLRRPTADELEHGMCIMTGAFVLDPGVFNQLPMPLKGNELGLPRTVLAYAAEAPVVVVPMPSWRTITYPKDIAYLEDYLASSSHPR